MLLSSPIFMRVMNATALESYAVMTKLELIHILISSGTTEEEIYKLSKDVLKVLDEPEQLDVYFPDGVVDHPIHIIVKTSKRVVYSSKKQLRSAGG
ncbi:hypothetical protein BCR41DRAFT_223347 [Lobosporangium transversale]|uniref:Uncharacterized protein n=1 Tax=Lobosporangium transversale TaxID=64571 RepID=A0A1Y2H060_9FUNG|nr:hypothetical protein BCR41DRAFT_223347 [Lobosporangium transversale]ORZ26452.1 hypothetical protein BCR41DRAFT_223347 [Lobosporangium transversale]|eukprot:XP_021884217.1 hypothetical protein BCR41DRAFT_223347 [Lobosporangium transversale]